MKNRTIIAGLTMLAFATTALPGCADFLDQESKTALTEEQVFAKLESIEQMVTGLYRTYAYDVRAGRTGIRHNAGLDESQQGEYQMMSQGVDMTGFDTYVGLSATSTDVSEMWSRRWKVMSPAADAINLLNNYKATEDQEAKINQLLGEAHFFRGLVAMELAMYWGEIPILEKSDLMKYGMGRQPLKEVWTYIINDLSTAADKLQASSLTDRKRATAGAAWALLGKAYMNAPQETELRDYDKAKAQFEKLMATGQYSLEPEFADLFDNSRNSYRQESNEAIFTLMYNNTDQVNHWEWDYGSRAANQAWEQGCYFAGFDGQVPTQYASLEKAKGGIWEAGDERKEISIRYDFTYHGQAASLSWTGLADELGPHVKKFEDIRTDKNEGNSSERSIYNSGKYFHAIRLADIYLLYAECLNRTSTQGAEGDATAYVNKVRSRAKLTTDMPAGDNFIDQIMEERVRELCFEGWRRMDLIRTGLFVKQVSKHNRWANKQFGGADIPATRMRLPIPDDEIKTNEDFVPVNDLGIANQNPGY